MSTPPDSAASHLTLLQGHGSLALLQLSRTFCRHLRTLQTHGRSLVQKQLRVKVPAGESSAKGEKLVVCVHQFEVGYLGKTTMDVT
jgi:hypothetical protein